MESSDQGETGKGIVGPWTDDLLRNKILFVKGIGGYFVNAVSQQIVGPLSDSQYFRAMASDESEDDAIVMGDIEESRLAESTKIAYAGSMRAIIAHAAKLVTAGAQFRMDRGAPTGVASKSERRAEIFNDLRTAGGSIGIQHFDR